VVREVKFQSEQVDDKPGRRQFQPEYKLRILQEIDTHRGVRGAIGEILRREGLYASQVAMWKRDLEAQLAQGIQSRKRGPKADPLLPLQKENERLTRQNARLKDELRRARLVNDAQKKIAEMFPSPSEEHSEMQNESIV